MKGSFNLVQKLHSIGADATYRDRGLLLAYDLHSLQGNGKLFICRDDQHLLVAIC